LGEKTIGAALSIGVERRLVANNDDHESQRPQRVNIELHPVGANARTETQKTNSPIPMATPRDRQITDAPGIWQRRGRTLSVVSDMPRKSPAIMMRTISKGVRIACPVMIRPTPGRAPGTVFVVMEFSVLA